MANLNPLNDPLIMWEAISPDGYPDIKGSPRSVYYNSPSAPQAQREADSKRDALILRLIKENRATELGELLIEQAIAYCDRINP